MTGTSQALIRLAWLLPLTAQALRTRVENFDALLVLFNTCGVIRFLCLLMIRRKFPDDLCDIVIIRFASFVERFPVTLVHLPLLGGEHIDIHWKRLLLLLLLLLLRLMMPSTSK